MAGPTKILKPERQGDVTPSSPAIVHQPNPSGLAQNILSLQRTAGNQATSQLLHHATDSSVSSAQRISEITINLATATITVSLDNDTIISGTIDEANLLPGEYHAYWSTKTNGLEITPFPTREKILHFNVKGTSTFLRHYDRLRRGITEQIPFKVVSEASLEKAAGDQKSTTVPTAEPPASSHVIYLTPEEARKRIESGDLPGVKTFPLRLPRGLWRWSVAPITAYRDGEDIVVKQTVSGVMGDPMFRREVRTLPTETFIEGVRLKPNEIVRVRLYDENEKLVYVTGEGMLELSKASDRATFFSILGTVVDAALFFVPASVVARPLAAAARAGRTGLAAAMIGTAEAAPTALGGVASRAVTTAVEERAVAGVTGQVAERTITQSVTRATEQGIVREATPAAQAALPATGSSLAVQAAARGAGVVATEAATRALAPDVSDEVDAAFTEHPSDQSGPYATTQRLARGNQGERHAAEYLAHNGHHIIIYKPSILGTNQGGIDIVTLYNGIVHLVDNKAISRGGRIYSVSALTTNFAQNLAAVERELTVRLASVDLLAGQRAVLQQTLNALRAGNYVRVVTNANIVSRDAQIVTGISQPLQDQGIQFINVFSQ